MRTYTALHWFAMIVASLIPLALAAWAYRRATRTIEQRKLHAREVADSPLPAIVRDEGE